MFLYISSIWHVVEIANFLYISLVSPNSKEKHTKVNISLFLVQVLVAFVNMQLKHITKRNHTKAKKKPLSASHLNHWCHFQLTKKKLDSPWVPSPIPSVSKSLYLIGKDGDIGLYLLSSTKLIHKMISLISAYHLYIQLWKCLWGNSLC